MNRLDLAREQFEQAMAIDGDDFMILYNAGLTCTLLNDLEKGLEYLQKATELNTPLYDAELTSAILRIKRDEPGKASTHLRNAIRINPKSGVARRILGDIHLHLDQPDKAAREYSCAIKLNPWDANALSGLARAYEIQNKNLDIALDLASQSLIVDPDNPYFRIRLARVHLKKGNFDSAEIEFSKAEQGLLELPMKSDDLHKEDLNSFRTNDNCDTQGSVSKSSSGQQQRQPCKTESLLTEKKSA